MKLGLSKNKVDLSVKHIVFSVNGEKHFISFRFSHRKGIQDAIFDSQEVKIIDTYPPLATLICECASIILSDIHTSIRKIVHRTKDHAP